MQLLYQGNKKSVKALIQIGLIASSLLPILSLLGIGVLVSQRFSGSIAMLLLLLISIAVVLIFFCTLLITVVVQHKIDALFAEVADQCRAYNEGNLSVRVPIYGTDSFAMLARTLNALFYKQSIRSEQHSHAATHRTPDYASAFAEHDSPGHSRTQLRVVAHVQENIPSSEESDSLRLQQIQHTGSVLARTARTLIDRTSFQEQAARAQAIQIFQTTEKIEGLALFMHQMTRNAQGSASLAQAGMTRIQKSEEVISDTLEDIEKLQHKTQQAIQQVYRIGEQTQAITVLIETVEQIAEQVTQLGLHPLLQPQDSGDQDPELAQLAQHIRALTAYMSSATIQVTTIANSIGAQAQETVIALQKSRQEVVEKTEQVREANQLLHNLYDSMKFQAGMIEDIAQAASEQTNTVESAASSMSQIAQVAYQSSKDTQQNVQALKRLVTLSDQVQLSASSESETPSEPHLSLRPGENDRRRDQSSSTRQSHA